MNLQQDTVLKGARALLGTLPEADRAAVSLALVADCAEHLSPEARQALLQTLPKEQSAVLTPATSSSSSTKLAKTDSQEITLQGSPTIEIHVQVNGQTVRAVLSDASFNKSRINQNSYAEGLGGRLATREDNRAVANDLLEKEEKGTLNSSESCTCSPSFRS